MAEFRQLAENLEPCPTRNKTHLHSVLVQWSKLVHVHIPLWLYRNLTDSILLCMLKAVLLADSQMEQNTLQL